MKNEVVLVGHVTIDTIVKGNDMRRSLGGTVVYGSLASLKHGAQPVVYSKIGRDFPDEYLIWLSRMGIDISGIKFCTSPTTKFKIRYEGGGRSLFLMSRCDDILPEDIDVERIRNKAVIVGPIISEIPLETLRLIAKHGAIIALDIQGYVRKVNEERFIELSSTPIAVAALHYSDVIHAEASEVAALTGVEDPVEGAKRLIDMGAGIILVTLGLKGSYVVTRRRVYFVPSASSRRVVDETGSGDVFVTVFTIEYQKSGDIAEAAAMATAAASFLVEAVGPGGLRSRWEVRRRAASVREHIEEVE